MLAANEAVAAHLETPAIPSIFRIHEPPDPQRVMEFEDLAARFGYSLGLGALPVKRFPMRGPQARRPQESARTSSAPTSGLRSLARATTRSWSPRSRASPRSASSAT